MNRMTIALFKQQVDAEAVRQRLLEAGIAAEINEERLYDKLWLVSEEAVGARLEVPAGEFERAEDLLVHWDEREGGVLGAIRCPECNSFRVAYPQFTRRSVLTNLAAGIAAQAGLVEMQYYCEDCHLTWSKEGERSRPRKNLAPNYFLEDVEPNAVKQPR